MSKIRKLQPNGERRLLISMSGGETSAFMTLWLLAFTRKHWDDIVVVFANTGQENEETLRFVHHIETHYNVRIVWVEATVHHGVRKASTHRVVTFETASRDGEPFEQVIQKYGIPNASYPHCTRELKERPIHSYVREDLGWRPSTYATAIGIRTDECDRMSAKAKKEGWIYPLVSVRPMSKKDVNAFWDSQPRRLQLKGYQGNCKWCWKKTLRKHYTLINEDESQYDFPRRMERDYAHAGAGEGPRVFFRGNQTAESLIAEAKAADFVPFHDDAQVYDAVLDATTGGCSDSCEAFTGDLE